MPKPVCTLDVDALSSYPVSAFDLIPLHPYAHTSARWKVDKATGEKVRRVTKDGKRPRDKNWTTAEYNTAKVRAAAVRDGFNVGVRLRKDQLVVDVDPRNGGDKGFADLCEELGIDPAAFPTVITGSGGLHIYMTKPDDLLVLDTLPDFPGVEFKSKGRQVVSAGSIHPDTLKHYEWDALTPSIADGMPDAPDALLRVIARPDRGSVIKGGGQWSQEDAARALDALDPEDFREESEWRRVMMGIHHATNGDARHEFIEWSTRDPGYADDAEIIGRRWDSLHTERQGGDVITFRTIMKIIGEKGTGKFEWVDEGERESDFDDLDALNDDDDKPAAEGDFDFGWTPPTKPKAKSKLPGGKSVDDDDGVPKENPGGFNDASTALLEKLNDTYATISDGGKFKIIYQKYEADLKRQAWERMSPSDFMLKFSNQRVERSEAELEKLSRGASPTAPLGKAWMEWASRKDHEGMYFDPTGTKHEGWLNIWTGFDYGSGSKDGSWKYLNDLIYEVLAEGNDANYAYILNWIRFLFQHPERRAEVAMVFKGGKGVGKGTLGNTIAKVIGRHAIAIQSPGLLTGRFNSHFRDLLFLFADEAVKPHNKDGESMLKGLITEPEIAIEAKNENVKPTKNYLHVMMASNEHWVVPASPDERRYFVAECALKYQGNAAWFDKLYAELAANDDSGYKRFLWDMLKTPITPGFHPRNYPMTGALLDQKVHSLSVLSQFFFNALNEDRIPFTPFKGDWRKERVRVFVESFKDAFAQWQKESGINPNSMGRGNMRNVFADLAKLFPSSRFDLRDPVTEDFEHAVQAAPSDGRAKSFELPSMEECRKHFRESMGGDCFAPESTGELTFG